MEGIQVRPPEQFQMQTNTEQPNTRNVSGTQNNELEAKITQPRRCLGFRICLTTFLTISVLVLLAGLLALFVAPSKINSKIASALELKNGTDRFKKWTTPTVMRKMNVYLFNITNPDEVMDGHVARLEQVGPYKFVNDKRKLVLEQNDTHITYRELNNISFFDDFEESKAQGDTVFLVNTLLVSTAKKLIKQQLSGDPVFSMAIGPLQSIISTHPQKLVFKTTVAEFLITGMNANWLDKLLKIAQMFNPKVKNPLVNGTFAALRDTKNHSFTILRNIDDGDKDFAQIVGFNEFVRETPFWNSKNCNQLKGTDGAQFNPFLENKKETLYIYSPEMCRAIPLLFEKEVTLHGIKLWRFTVPSSFMANATLNPENSCICENTTQCPPGGVTPVEKCQDGKALFISAPHFYNGDLNELLQKFQGLNPTKNLHETYLDIHPKTGLTLRVRKRIQINADVTQWNELGPLQHITSGIYPLLWLEEEAELAEDKAKEFKERIEYPQQLASEVTFGLLVAGAVSTIFFGVVLLSCFYGMRRSMRLTLFRK